MPLRIGPLFAIVAASDFRNKRAMHTLALVISSIGVTEKDMVLLLSGIVIGGVLSFLASLVVGRFLYFRQLVDQAMAEGSLANAALKPSSLVDHLAVFMSIGSRASGFATQLHIHGHTTAADVIKESETEFTDAGYAAVRLLHSIGPKLSEAEQKALTAEFHRWLTMQIGVYMLKVGSAKPSKWVLFMGFRKSPSLGKHTQHVSFEEFRKLTPEQKQGMAV